MLVLFWIILSIVVSAIGSKRKIGGGWAFVASLFLSPLIGAIIVLASERKSDIAYKEKMLRYMSGEQSIASEEELSKVRSAGIAKIKKFSSPAASVGAAADKIGLYVLLALIVVVVLGSIIYQRSVSELVTENPSPSEVMSTMSPKENLLYRIKNDMGYTRDEIEATFTTLGTINTRVDGVDVGYVKLWSTTGRDRKINASLKNRTEVCIMGNENGYLLVGTIKSPAFEWGYCMDGFVRR